MTLIIILILITTGILFVGYTYFYHTRWFDRFEGFIAFMVSIGWIIILIVWAVMGRMGM